MIDFPQMVSVSHRNAQMYFDRDVECIFKFFRKRFNLSFEESLDDIDGSDEGKDEAGKPCFSAIERSAGFLDRELAASGFTRKEEEDIQRFIEGRAESDTNSDSEDVDLVEDENEASTIDGNSSDLLEQNEGCENQGKVESCEARESSGSEKEDASDNEENSEEAKENEAELVKSLSKQRRRAVAAVRKGRKSAGGRNSYKDKGGRSSNNSKVQKQLSIW